MRDTSESLCHPPARILLHGQVQSSLAEEERGERELAQEVRVDELREIEAPTAPEPEGGPGEEVEVRGERAVGEIVHHAEPRRFDYPEKRLATVEHRVLGRLEPRPAVAIEAERQAVQAGHLDHQASSGLERSPGPAKRPGRVVVVLEEVPHGDQIEAAHADVLLVEQTAVELDLRVFRPPGEVLEVDADHAGPVP